MQRGEKKLLAVLKGEPSAIPPVWLMRQAGRYLPAYRETRKQAGSFLDLCYTPELAEEVTLQPIRRYDFDASILFADILLVPQAMGMNLWFVEGEGPMMSWPKDQPDLGSLKPNDEIDDTLEPVYETVKRLSSSLPAQTTLIGFAGAPWTVATYMIAGRGTKDQGPARQMMFGDPDMFSALIDRITDATLHYLRRQIDSGAEVVKIFDSWASALTPDAFRRFAVAPAKKIVDGIRATHPGTPVIGFPRGVGALYPEFADLVKCDAVALDSQVPLDWARESMGGVPLQGNLDPMYMVVGGDTLMDAAKRIVDDMRGYPHIFNLGHGITPDANPAHVDQLLKAIRG
ncbi:MAG: uroporphyrinogen decarboxylase [Pseudomonadota bacterium]